MLVVCLISKMHKFHSFLVCIILSLFLFFFVTVFATGIGDRIDCRTVEESIDEGECIRRGCTWANRTEEDKQYGEIPQCFVDNKIGYKVEKQSQTPNSVVASLKITSPETHEINCTRLEDLNLEVHYITDKIVRIKINSAFAGRYEVPVQKDFNIPSFIEQNGKYKQYDVAISDADATISVTRKDNGAKLIDTSIGGMIFCDKYIQFSTFLPKNADFYGFGENYRNAFRQNTSYTTIPMFPRSRAPGNENANYNGQHPFMMGVQKDGKSFGLFLVNSNAMAYSFLPAPAVSLRMTGGIIDVFVMLGSNPEEVVSLYTSIIGRPMFPPFWALGYHNSRNSYSNDQSIKDALERHYLHNVPVDVQHVDTNYMEKQRDFTYDENSFGGLPDLIRQTKDKYSLKWALALNPSIEAVDLMDNKQEYTPFTEGNKNDVFIKWPEDIGKTIRFPPGVPTDKFIFYGALHSTAPVAYPDFLRERTKTWWKPLIQSFHNKLDFDALNLFDNEPTNDDQAVTEYKCPTDSYFLRMVGMKFNEPLHTRTICMDVNQGDNNQYHHYDVHSLYGLSQTIPTLEALNATTKKRGFVLSTSTYPSSGKYSGRMLYSVRAEWDELRKSIIAMMQFNLFGIPFTGAPICGAIGEVSAELCRRWFQASSFSPLAITFGSSGFSTRDAVWWADNGHPEVTKAAVESLRLRYQFLYYLYTTFYNAHVNGQTVVRPMHHVFTVDETSRTVNEQFFIGSSIMVTPFLYPGQTSVNAYLPGSEPNWYKLSDDFVIKINPVSNYFEVKEFESSRPLFLPGGSILPIVSIGDLPEPLNTVVLRKAPISLWVLPNFEGSASGQLFLDDGVSLNTIENGHYLIFDFSLRKCVLTISLKNKESNAFLHNIDNLELKQIYIALDPNKLADLRSDNIGFNIKEDGKNSNNASLILDPKHYIRIRFNTHLDLVSSFNESIQISLFNKEDDGANCFLD